MKLIKNEKLSQDTRLMRKTKAHNYKINLENINNSKQSWKYVNKLHNRKSKTTAVNQLKISKTLDI